MQISFLGGIGRVTGSCTIMRTRNAQFLVDCGMVQGEVHQRAENNKPFPFNPRDIKFVFLTHAHLDHCGLLPRLYKEGFVGKVYCTCATAKLAQVVLFDSAKFDVPYEKKHIERIDYYHVDESRNFKWGKLQPADEGIMFAFFRSSHILGSVSIGITGKLGSKNKGIWFSGDIGNNTSGNCHQPLLKKTQTPDDRFSYMVCESTYGDRDREQPTFEQRTTQLANVIEKTLYESKGNLIIPAFSLHRTQEILIDLHYIRTVLWKQDDALSSTLKVFCDSPMGSRISKIYTEELGRCYKNDQDSKHLYLNESIKQWLGVSSEHVLDELETAFKKEGESRAKKNGIQKSSTAEPLVIVSSAGMCNGGPILKHLENNLKDPRNTILMVGYQGGGSNGAMLSSLIEPGIDFADAELKLGNNRMKVSDVKASIQQINGYSGHADRQGLLNYIFSKKGSQYSVIPTVFLNHGTNTQRDAFKSAIAERQNRIAAECKAGDSPSVEVIVPQSGDGWFDLEENCWLNDTQENLAKNEQMLATLMEEFVSLRHEVDSLYKLVLSNGNETTTPL